MVGARTVEEGTPVVGAARSFRYLALHELRHSFVNPTTAQFRERVELYAALPEPIREQMTALADGNWETAVNEHILRAVTTRMVYRSEGEASGDAALNGEKVRGFAYVPALVAKLEE